MASVTPLLWFDGRAAARVNQAMMSMVKLDAAALDAAYKGETP